MSEEMQREKTGGEAAPDGRVVLCGANSYEQKYYFNRDFEKLPPSIQDELHILCVLFTEEVGGIFTVLFEKDGGISLETTAAQEDYLYDEVSGALLLGEVRRKRQELFEALSLYYRAAVLKEGVELFSDRTDP